MESSELLRNSLVYRFSLGPTCPPHSSKSARLPLKDRPWPCVVSASVSVSASNSLSAAAAAAALSMENPPEGYRRNVGICLVNPSSKQIFAASRINIPDTWQMPQGGADEGEDLRNAAMRELREETGVTSAEFLAEAPYWLTYDFPLQVRERLNRRWGTNYKGQAQKWFLFKFTGKEEEINLMGDGSEMPEFKDWSWMLPEQVVELAVDFKKPVYEQVMKLFSPYLREDGEGNTSAQKEPSAEAHSVPV